MVELSPERKQELLIASRDQAIAFIEDMPHIRDVLSDQEHDRGEIRRLSNVLRRLLIDNNGDLLDIAAPRVGQITILTPDNKPIYKADKKKAYLFASSAGVESFGVHWRAALFESGRRPQPLEDFDPGRLVPLRLDNFLSQHVLGMQGRWASRRDAIKYMANVASGVHSGVAKTDQEKLLGQVRKCVAYSVREVAIDGNVQKVAHCSFDANAASGIEPPFRYTPDAIDPVLVELLATARFLTISPDIVNLEKVVREELAQSG